MSGNAIFGRGGGRVARSICRAGYALALLGFLATSASSPAVAAPLAFSAELRVELALLGPPVLGSGFLAPLVANANGVAMVSGSGAFSLPADVFTGSAAVTSGLDLSGVGAVTINRLTVANGPGSFGTNHVPPGLGTGASIAGGGLGGAMSLGGNLIFDVLGGLFMTPVPFGVVGAGGAASNPNFGSGPILFGTAWTTGVASVPGANTKVTYFTVSTFAVTQTRTVPRTLSGFDTRTPSGVGTLQMVTPIRFGAVGAGPPLPGFATLTITFVPEPGSLVLCGTAAAAVLVIQRRCRS